MLSKAMLTYMKNPKFLHNYANGPDGSMMSVILFDIHTLQSTGVQTHALRHRFKVNVPTTYLVPCNYLVFPLTHTSTLSAV